MAEKRGVDRVTCLGGTLDRVAHLDMLEFERDLRPLVRDGADGRGLRIVGKGGRRHRIGLCRAEQESRVRCEHRVEQRLFPTLAELGKARLFRVQRLDSGKVLGSRCGRDETLEPGRAALQRLAFQFRDKGIDV